MSNTIVFIGSNERITPLQIDAMQSGFDTLQVCAFDYEYKQAKDKLKYFLQNQKKPVLFRFIFPFKIAEFSERISNAMGGGSDESLAKAKIFEEFVSGWQDFISGVDVPIIEINSLDAIIKQRDKSFQYKKLSTEIGYVPETIHLKDCETSDPVVALLNRSKGVIYKPISGAESKGIYIIKKEGNSLLLQSDIKGKRPTKDITGYLDANLNNLYSKGYVVQELVEFSNLFGGYDFDLRIHVIGGEVAGSAAFVYNRDTQVEEVHNLGNLLRTDIKFAETFEKAQYVAVQATQKLGLQVSGVDLMLGGADYRIYITEVNSFPGWAMLDANPDLDISRKEVDFYKKMFDEFS